MTKAFFQNGKVRFGAGLFGLCCLIALAGPWIAAHLVGHPARAIDYEALGAGPGGGHLLGTTRSGEDVLAQILVGARGSIVIGLVTGVVSTVLAVLVGVTAGFLGGWVDKVGTLFTNVMLTLPGLPLILIIAGYLTATSALTIGVLLGCLGWAASARYLRAQTLSLRNRDFVVAMRMVGESRTRLIACEVLPHLTGMISAVFLAGVVAGVLGDAALAFLGVAVSHTLSWGTMISEAQSQSALLGGQWWWFVPPGCCIALLGSAIALMNFGIDEVTNPRLRAGRPALIRRYHQRRQALAGPAGPAGPAGAKGSAA